MRLLEFETANSGTHAQEAALTRKPRKKHINQASSTSPKGLPPKPVTATVPTDQPSTPAAPTNHASTMTATAPTAVVVRPDATAAAAAIQPPVPPGQVLPMKPKREASEAVRRQPIDIEQLQQRIEVLERRMRERARVQGSQLPVKDMDKLKQRMKLLERTVHNELWAAKQREHTLLEMLARPPLKHLIRDQLKRLHTQALPATHAWFTHFSQDWWDLNQPVWWDGFARAWQESLDKARGNHYS